MATYQAIGPAEIPLENLKRGRIIATDLSSFWNTNSSVAGQIGCYVFARKYGTGYKPIYVGQTRRSFKEECFAPSKLNKYNIAIASASGKPVMFFIATSGKPTKKKLAEIDEIETYLISIGKMKNPDLANIMKTRQPSWSIDGVVRGRQGRNTSASREFRKMIGL